jgi:hypothetical protein
MVMISIYMATACARAACGAVVGSQAPPRAASVKILKNT